MYPVERSRIARIERLACIGETTSEIMHELNNQLTVLLGYATMLKKAQAESWKYADEMLMSCERCCGMAKGVLEFARSRRMERQRTDLRRVITKPVEIKTRLFESAAIKVRLTFPPECMEALVDEFQVQQVVFNILHNAFYELLKVKKRVLEVHGRREGGKAVIEFRDSGRGIRDEHVKRIFEPFFTTKPTGEGTGLGLSISRRIIEEHGGSLRVGSSNGRGATITLDLPLVEDPRLPLSTGVLNEAYGRFPARKVAVKDGKRDGPGMGGDGESVETDIRCGAP